MKKTCTGYWYRAFICYLINKYIITIKKKKNYHLWVVHILYVTFSETDFQKTYPLARLFDIFDACAIGFIILCAFTHLRASWYRSVSSRELDSISLLKSWAFSFLLLWLIMLLNWNTRSWRILYPCYAFKETWYIVFHLYNSVLNGGNSF